MSELSKEYLDTECRLVNQVINSVNELHDFMNEAIEKETEGSMQQLEVAVRSGMLAAVDGAIDNFKRLHDDGHQPKLMEGLLSSLINKIAPQGMKN